MWPTVFLPVSRPDGRGELCATLIALRSRRCIALLIYKSDPYKKIYTNSCRGLSIGVGCHTTASSPGHANKSHKDSSSACAQCRKYVFLGTFSILLLINTLVVQTVWLHCTKLELSTRPSTVQLQDLRLSLNATMPTERSTM